MNVEIKNSRRVSLVGQNTEMEFLDIAGNSYSYEVSVDKYLGEGTSCICYEVAVRKSKDDIWQKRILKQFYPDPQYYEIDTKMEETKLEISGYSDDIEVSKHKEINKLGDLFEAAYKRQIELSNIPDLSGIVVCPELCYFNGATKYILYEIDYGSHLDVGQSESIDVFLEKMYDLAFALCQLHKQGLLYMDLKPENILVSENGAVKIFDFDAVVDLNRLADVHIANDGIRYDISHLELIAPEIRPENLGEFEQNKQFLLTERIDIYSFGAIMLYFFLHRYPTEKDCTKQAFTEEMKAIFNDRYRGELTEEEQKFLNTIIWKCIQTDLGQEGRYCHTSDLADDLKELKDSIAAPVSKRRRIYNRVNGRFQAAYIMDKYPLAKYRRKLSDTDWILDSLIIGEDPINEDFFVNILACSQMLDTKHVIRIALPDAEAKLKKYICEWPLLAKTMTLYLNDVLIDNNFVKKAIGLDTTITKTPFASICFYEWDASADIVSFYENLKDVRSISWIVMSSTDPQVNIDMAEKIADKMEENCEKSFIAYMDDRGDGYSFREFGKVYKNVILSPFSNIDTGCLKEEQFEKGIRKKAKLLHKYYMREWNERASKMEIWRDFSSEAYNLNSSLCSVLSIPYKLESIGICTAGSQAAAEYKKEVLDKNNPSAEENFNSLLYLEHRRWMCFMVTEGYNRPDKKALEQYAFRGKNDQRNKRDKLHPCICNCSKTGGIRLDRFSHDLWERTNFSDLAKVEGAALDELDTMSVQFHQLCKRKIVGLVRDGEFETALFRLEKAMKNEKFLEEDFVILNSMRIILHRMIDNESNINSLWRKVCNSFSEMLAKRAKSCKIHTEEVNNAFKKLKNLMRIVVERNSYHDYKSNDRTILEALPFLLLSDDPIRRIHKPAAGKTWQNIVSSIIIEPEQLFLYTDNEETLELDLIRSFLEKERGIYIDSIQVQTMEDLKKLTVKNTSVKSVLDITGLSAEEVFTISSMENLKKLPVIIFKEGKIHSLRGEAETGYYSVLRRHITVGETFRLFHANIYTENKHNYMLGLADNYEHIWNAYIEMNSFRYKILVETLNKIERGHYWKLSKDKKSARTVIFQKTGIPDGMLQSPGISKLLADLLKDKWIESGYVVPESGQTGNVFVKTKSEEVKNYLEKAFTCIKKFPYFHNFVYLKTCREPVTGKPLEEELYYIYDDTLIVAEEISNRIVDSEKNTDCKSVMLEALQVLEKYKIRKTEASIISSLDDGSELISQTEGDDSQFRAGFIYRNRAIKECLLKEGNILEAYVYYTIWKNAFVDDVKLNVAFTWDAEGPEEALFKSAITNEVDIICTRNMQTYFISCKQSMPKTEYLQEIKYFSDYFGIDGKAILISSNCGTSGQPDRNDAKRISSRSQKMQVYYIDREMLGRNLPEMNQRRLAKYIQNIFDGKKDWKTIK